MILTPSFYLGAFHTSPQTAYDICTVAGHFKLSGADHPGIVHKLTSTLANKGLTIGNMKTSHEEAPFGGTELFTSEYLCFFCLCSLSRG